MCILLKSLHWIIIMIACAHLKENILLYNTVPWEPVLWGTVSQEFCMWSVWLIQDWGSKADNFFQLTMCETKNYFRRTWELHRTLQKNFLPIRRKRKLRRALETPGAPCSQRWFHFSLVLEFGQRLKTWMIIYCNAALSLFLREKQSNHVTWTL